MRILVCGGRGFDNYDALKRELDQLNERFPISCVIHGGARGADYMAGLWATQKGICQITFHANWNHYGSRAGPIRNGWMIRHGLPDLIVAFPGGRGTGDMVAKAERHGIPVHDLRQPQ